tara:strand:+ start:292 stop:483 length:192 start_codon:yes stop_codon:yes gene_type:complete
MMNDLITYLLIAFVFLLIGSFVGKLLTKLKLEKEKATLKERTSLLMQYNETAEKKNWRATKRA